MTLLGILLLAVVTAVIAVMVFRRKEKDRTPPSATYRCDICGQYDCDCHREPDAEPRRPE